MIRPCPESEEHHFCKECFCDWVKSLQYRDALGDQPARRAKVDASYDQSAQQMNPKGVI